MPSLCIDPGRWYDAREPLWKGDSPPWLSVWLNPASRSGSTALAGNSQAPAPGRSVTHFREEAHEMLPKSPFSISDDAGLTGFHCSSSVQMGVGERFGVGIAFQKPLLWGDDEPKDLLVALTIGRRPSILISVHGKQMGLSGPKQSCAYIRLGHDDFKLPVIHGLGAKVLVGVTITPLVGPRALESLPVTPLAAFDFEVQTGNLAREKKFCDGQVPQLRVLDRPRLRALLLQLPMPPMPRSEARWLERYEYQDSDSAATSANTVARLDSSKDRRWTVKPLPRGDDGAQPASDGASTAGDGARQQVPTVTEQVTSDSAAQEQPNQRSASSGSHSSASWKALPKPTWPSDTSGVRTPMSGSQADESELGTPPREQQPVPDSPVAPAGAAQTSLALVPYVPPAWQSLRDSALVRLSDSEQALTREEDGHQPSTTGENAPRDVVIDDELGKLAALKEKVRLNLVKKRTGQAASRPDGDAACAADIKASPQPQSVPANETQHQHVEVQQRVSLIIKGTAASSGIASLPRKPVTSPPSGSSPAQSHVAIPTAPRNHRSDAPTSPRAALGQARTSSQPPTGPRADIEAAQRAAVEAALRDASEGVPSDSAAPASSTKDSEAATSSRSVKDGPLHPSRRDNTEAGKDRQLDSAPERASPDEVLKPPTSVAAPLLFHDMSPPLSAKQRQKMKRSVEQHVPWIPGPRPEVGTSAKQKQQQAAAKGKGQGQAKKGGQAQSAAKRSRQNNGQSSQSPQRKQKAEPPSPSSSIAPTLQKTEQRPSLPAAGPTSSSLLSAVGAGPLVAWLGDGAGSSSSGPSSTPQSKGDAETQSGAKTSEARRHGTAEEREERSRAWRRMTGMDDRQRDADKDRSVREERNKQERERDRERDREKRRDRSRSPTRSKEEGSDKARERDYDRDHHHRRNRDRERHRERDEGNADQERHRRSERGSRGDEKDNNDRGRERERESGRQQHRRRHRERDESRGRSRSRSRSRTRSPRARDERRRRHNRSRSHSGSRSRSRTRHGSAHEREREIKRERHSRDRSAAATTAVPTPEELERIARHNELLAAQREMHREVLNMQLQSQWLAQLQANGICYDGGGGGGSRGRSTEPSRPPSAGALVLPGQAALDSWGATPGPCWADAKGQLALPSASRPERGSPSGLGIHLAPPSADLVERGWDGFVRHPRSTRPPPLAMERPMTATTSASFGSESARSPYTPGSAVGGGENPWRLPWAVKGDEEPDRAQWEQRFGFGLSSPGIGTPALQGHFHRGLDSPYQSREVARPEGLCRPWDGTREERTSSIASVSVSGALAERRVALDHISPSANKRPRLERQPGSGEAMPGASSSSSTARHQAPSPPLRISVKQEQPDTLVAAPPRPRVKRELKETSPTPWSPPTPPPPPPPSREVERRPSHQEQGSEQLSRSQDFSTRRLFSVIDDLSQKLSGGEQRR